MVLEAGGSRWSAGLLPSWNKSDDERCRARHGLGRVQRSRRATFHTSLAPESDGWQQVAQQGLR